MAFTIGLECQHGAVIWDDSKLTADQERHIRHYYCRKKGCHVYRAVVTVNGQPVS